MSDDHGQPVGSVILRGDGGVVLHGAAGVVAALISCYRPEAGERHTLC